MKKTFVVALCAVSAVAFAGKPERDKQKEVTTQLAEHAKAIKASCGCDVKLSPKWDSYKKADDMSRINYVGEAFATAAKKQCESDEDKKALCGGVNTIEIRFDKGCSASPELKGKTISAVSDDSCYNGDHQFAAIIEKF